MMAHQQGLENVVVTLGTALTELHVRTLKRFSRKVVLVFDGDEAGQRAAERAIVKFLAQDVDLRILTLPDGLDPADFLPALLDGGLVDCHQPRRCMSKKVTYTSNSMSRMNPVM